MKCDSPNGSRGGFPRIGCLGKLRTRGASAFRALMPMMPIRTAWIGLSAAAVLAVAASASAGLDQDEFLENGAGKFAVDIPGCPVATANIQSVQVEDLTIDVRETTCGVDWDFRTYAPGDAHYGKATFRSRVGKNSRDLIEWLNDAASGKNVRKNIAVIVKDRAGAEARRWNLLDALPVAWTVPDEAGEEVATVVLRYGRIVTGDPDDPEPEPAVDWPNGCMWEPGATIDPEPIPRQAARFFLLNGMPFAVRVYDREYGHASQWIGVSHLTPPVAIERDPELEAKTWWQRAYTTEAKLTLPPQRAFDFLTSTHGEDRKLDLLVVELDPTGKERRRAVYRDSFVTRYEFPYLVMPKFDPGDYSPSSTTRVETIVVKVGFVEFAK